MLSCVQLSYRCQFHFMGAKCSDGLSLALQYERSILADRKSVASYSPLCFLYGRRPPSCTKYCSLLGLRLHGICPVLPPPRTFVSSCKPQWGWLQNPDEAGAFPWTYAEANGCYRMTLLTTTEGTDAKRHQCSYCSLRDEKGFRQSWRNTCPAFEPVEETPG